MHENGTRISLSILEDLEYWNYLQRCIGYTSPHRPARARPNQGMQLEKLEEKVSYLVDLYESMLLANLKGSKRDH